jgi:hypothetical protein
VHFRPGNVHDSNGAEEFIAAQVDAVLKHLPDAKIESRLDSAFFGQSIVDTLNSCDVDFSISVPYHRFSELKSMTESIKKWHCIKDGQLWFHEQSWKPQAWKNAYRFIFVKSCKRVQDKEPIQLDLFVPSDYYYEYKVIVTNKTASAKSVIAYHEGRGAQESVFAELKSNAALEYIPFNRYVPNQVFLLANVFAHNLNRSLQIEWKGRSRGQTAKRTQIMPFQTLQTIRNSLLMRAGRFTRPKNVLTLTIAASNYVKEQILEMLNAIKMTA